MTTTTYAMVNESHAPKITIPVLSTWVNDLQDAYDGPFGSVWGILACIVTLGVPQSRTDILRIAHLVDTIPEASDALAYHTVDDQGNAVLRIGVETIRQNLQPGQNLSDEITKAISHELFETAIDASAALYCYVNGKNAMLAYEVCDPVQGGSWKQGSTAISNYVTPDYFDASTTSKNLDKCGQLSTPLACASEGYQAWSDGTQTFGEKVTEFKKSQIVHFGRRSKEKKRK
jgi:hypothetical protein